MTYFKVIYDDGFVSVSTLDANIQGNSTKEEYDLIAEMYHNAEEGYGVKETPEGFVYEKYQINEDEIDEMEAFSILMGEE